ncbi:MAG: MotA/TolQ/ExbB proton channel family protein [Methylococcales symbiont of Iophon sp. n. MRB-2018]|nr:MAG: MotA/TolQ/ExbB proton channel family protein [Methylococcales symbiont of Iophon sp. n. MRB-2018]KAF3980486.1 MAG: MotA/TolQ/ExbB proton channel family protein [Methylococcales symbiont of Iophon sp. n. MRB-2018]
MKKVIFAFLLISCTQTVFAKHLGLDQLLRDVKKSQGLDARINKVRETQFLAEKNQQQRLLQSTRAKLAQQERLSLQLKKHLEEGEILLSKLETKLKNRSGILGELFGVARQAAGDLKADLRHSLVSAQFGDRINKLDSLANSKVLPTIEQLETLWYTLQHEMTESGKVVYFNSEIEQTSGKPVVAKVIRIGAFNALSEGNYLQFSPDTGRLTHLSRQPDSHYLSLAEDMATATTGTVTVGIDPTRGVILSMLIQAPDTVERINQGGVIGFIILILGITGFMYGIFRLVNLSITSQKMTAQMSTSVTSTDNPLGRIFAMAEQDKSSDTENLELILDEAITREIPALEKGLPMIKLLAAVAPLLGLLGTVTGMIATFQSISLFGTGDPKLMAGGISQALVTTMLGLCVAIPLLFLHSLLASKSRILVQILDEQSTGLISQRSEK